MNAELSNLIVHGESETVEFKESFGDEALESMGAFANAQGGVLFIGVKDSGSILGVQLGKKTLEDIANRIQEITDPRIQPDLSILKIEEKRVIVIQIPSVAGAPVSVRGRYYKRVGKSNQRLTHHEIMRRMVISTGLSWDAIVEPTAKLDDLDVTAMNNFVQILREQGRLSIPVDAEVMDVMRKLALIINEKPTRAAILLFGINPESFFSSAFLKLGRFRSPTKIVDDREVHGKITEQLNGAMSWFKERLNTEFIITGKPERDVKWEYPLTAIREAVTNAVCHRDYTGFSHTQIRLYDERLEIWNAGSLPSSLTADELFYEHDSVPRNRKIAEVFFYMGLIERWGSGTLRMIDELKTAGLPQPQFESESGRFRVTFKRELLDETYSYKMGLSERQLKAIVYIEKHGSITNTDLQSIANISKSTATRELNFLKKKGILLSKGTTGRGFSYFLKGS